MRSGLRCYKLRFYIGSITSYLLKGLQATSFGKDARHVFRASDPLNHRAVRYCCFVGDGAGGLQIPHTAPMTIPGIKSWLTTTRTKSSRYAHQFIKEDPTKWPTISNDLCNYFRQAHDDVIRQMRALAGTSLHPLKKKKQSVDPAAHYPFRLHETVLKGYFGEILGAAVAQSFSPGGHDDWEVPAFLFRNHRVAFQQLEHCRQSGETPGPIPGRFGDDFLAFRRNRKTIISVLYGEAKCTSNHDAGMISEAHEKVANGSIVDILQVIEVLLNRKGDSDAEAWVPLLRELHNKLPGGNCDRYDCVCYFCGKAPTKRTTWITPNTPHENYGNTGRFLEAIEVHLSDVDNKIKAVYAERVWTK